MPEDASNTKNTVSQKQADGWFTTDLSYKYSRYVICQLLNSTATDRLIRWAS